MATALLIGATLVSLASLAAKAYAGCLILEILLDERDRRRRARHRDRW